VRPIKKFKKHLEQWIGNAVPVRIKKGLIKGKKLYGVLFFNRRLDELSDEEILYKSLNLEGKVVFDLGSNIGAYTTFFSDSVRPEGKVYAFEPNPNAFNLLRKNMKVNGCNNVKIYNIGVSDKENTLEFISKKFILETGSFDREIQKRLMNGLYGVRRWEIKVNSLDNIFRNEDPGGVDFIKIDIEGHEINALNGSVELIRKYSPDIYIEVHGMDNAGKLSNLKTISGILKAVDENYTGIHLPDGVSVDEIVEKSIDIDYTYRNKMLTYDNYSFYFSVNKNILASLAGEFGGKKYWRIR